MRADFRGVPGKIHLVSCHLVVREDPYMRMRDLIADAFGEYPIGRKRFLLGLRYLSRHFKILADIRHIPDPAIMCLWDNLYMTRRLRVDVEEGEKLLIFVHLG